MNFDIKIPEYTILKPTITVLGVGGAGSNAINNMIKSNLKGTNFIVANTDAQALETSESSNKIQLGISLTQGLGAGASPDIGKAAAIESENEIRSYLQNTNMVFITAGMGGGTGTGATPIIAKIAQELEILTVGIITKPFFFEGERRIQIAEKGTQELQKYVDTLITIPNQNLFRITNSKTTFQEAFQMADEILNISIKSITDLITVPGLINLDFADIKTIMSEKGRAMIGIGEAQGEGRATKAAEYAIDNPLLDNNSIQGASGVLINISSKNVTLYEIDSAANKIKESIGDINTNIIFGSTIDKKLEDTIRVSVVATGIENSQTLNNKNEVSIKDDKNMIHIVNNTNSENNKPYNKTTTGTNNKLQFLYKIWNTIKSTVNFNAENIEKKHKINNTINKQSTMKDIPSFYKENKKHNIDN